MSQVPRYRDTWLIRKRHPLGPYSRHMLKALWRSCGGCGFLWARYPRNVSQHSECFEEYRGTSLIKKRNPLGPYSRPLPRILEGS